MQTRWRLAFMFDARGDDLAALEAGLCRAGERIRAAAGGNAVRYGVTIGRGTFSGDEDPQDMAQWRTVDGAIEVSITNGGEAGVPDVCRAMRPLLDELAEPGTVEVMTGAMHHMVPVRPGGNFLSLAFRRYPGTTIPQFRDWWYNQHSKVAIPVLGDHLLAYDQVHVDEAATRGAAEALGVAFVEYDAYDNLTWADLAGAAASTADAAAMAVIAEDEVGRIDNTTRRHAMMRDLA